MSKFITAVVVSNKMQNTIVVEVQREYQHPQFRKVVTQHRNFKVHVEGEKPEVGTTVIIQSTKPISKDKHFILVVNDETEKAAVKPVKTTNKKVEKAEKVEKVEIKEAKEEIKVAEAKKPRAKKAKKAE